MVVGHIRQNDVAVRYDLTTIGRMNPGDILPISQGDQAVLLQLRETEPAPVDKAQAEPVIKRLLAESGRRKTASDSLEKLKSSAKIEYVKKFSDKPAAPAAPAASAPAAKPADSTDHLKEGLKGLK